MLRMVAFESGIAVTSPPRSPPMRVMSAASMATSVPVARAISTGMDSPVMDSSTVESVKDHTVHRHLLARAAQHHIAGAVRCADGGAVCVVTALHSSFEDCHKADGYSANGAGTLVHRGASDDCNVGGAPPRSRR